MCNGELQHMFALTTGGFNSTRMKWSWLDQSPFFMSPLFLESMPNFIDFFQIYSGNNSAEIQGFMTSISIWVSNLSNLWVFESATSVPFLSCIYILFLLSFVFFQSCTQRCFCISIYLMTFLLLAALWTIWKWYNLAHWLWWSWMNKLNLGSLHQTQ